MLIFKKYIPLAIVTIVGLLTLATYYVPAKASSAYLETLNQWEVIVAGFAFLLGLISLLMTHWKKIAKHEDGWGYSIFVFIGFLGVVIPGIISGGKQTDDGVQTALGWAFNYLYNPLAATMFAVLAFYIVSTAFRSFRIKSAQAFVLFICALILVLGNVPVGQAIWETLIGWSGLHIADLTDWLMSVVSVSAKRGIMIGLAVGGVVTCLKMIFTIERSYLGRDA